jgi:lysophospholipase L1-like esterase
MKAGKGIAAALLLLVGSASFLRSPAAAAEPTAEQRAQWAREAEERLHDDWAWRARFREENRKLAPASRRRIVFLGDSITQGWIDMVPGFFGPDRIDRGISGQTLPQMLVRFRQDVLSLHPAVVHIMAGTNDVAGNTGPERDEDIEDDVRTMTELAQAHGVRVILASIPPTSDFPSRRGLEPGPRIARLNAWIKAYAARSGAIYADYWSTLHDGLGFRPGLAYDGVHPTREGYAAMAPVANAAIARALALPMPGRALACARAIC